MPNIALINLPTPTHCRYSTLISDIGKGEVKIPQFQRDFVWTVQKSAALIDSIVKGYPIGTFIFWDTRERLRSVRNLGSISLPDPKDGETVSYVLDGQQRLTSLFAALKGLSIHRESGAVDDFSQIFLDLSAEKDEQIVVCDGTEKVGHSHIKVTDLLSGGFADLVKFPKKYHSRMDRYLKQIQSYDFSIIKVSDVPIDIATEIFTRINTGGEPLTLFEIMVAKTYDEEKGFDLSVKYNELVDRLSQIDYDTISEVTILQLISLLLSRDCKKQTILKLNKGQFIEKWQPAVEALESAAEYFRNSYRIPVSKLLPYNTLLVPFAYYFFHHPDRPPASHNKKLEDFFWRCSLGGRYSASVESKLAQDIKKITDILQNKDPEYDWPVDVSWDFLAENGYFYTGRAFIKAILCLYAFQEPKSFEDNSSVNIRNDWLKQANSRNYHHFFPKSYLEDKNFDWDANNVFNITIVDDYLNKRRIRTRAPSDYMKEFTENNPSIAGAMKTHIINLERFGVWEDNYDLFVEKRAKRVSALLQKKIIPRKVDTARQPVRSDDLEEEMTSYE